LYTLVCLLLACLGFAVKHRISQKINKHKDVDVIFNIKMDIHTERYFYFFVGCGLSMT
jgi:hypothetical protein